MKQIKKFLYLCFFFLHTITNAKTTTDQNTRNTNKYNKTTLTSTYQPTSLLDQTLTKFESLLDQIITTSKSLFNQTTIIFESCYAHLNEIIRSLKLWSDQTMTTLASFSDQIITTLKSCYTESTNNFEMSKNQLKTEFEQHFKPLPKETDSIFQIKKVDNKDEIKAQKLANRLEKKEAAKKAKHEARMQAYAKAQALQQAKAELKAQKLAHILEIQQLKLQTAEEKARLKKEIEEKNAKQSEVQALINARAQEKTKSEITQELNKIKNLIVEKKNLCRTPCEKSHEKSALPTIKKTEPELTRLGKRVKQPGVTVNIHLN